MLLFVALAAAAPAAAAPEPFQSTRVLDMIVAQFTGHGIGEEGGARLPVDPRLKLAACAAPQLSWFGEDRDAVMVRCMAPEWKIYVSVKAAPKPRPAVVAPIAPAPAPVRVERPAPPPKPEVVVRRGDTVTIEVGAPGFSITRQGMAMSDAPAGGRIQVKVDDKKPPIQVVVVEAGRATLPGWGE
ncbi:flagella basal body P-ring formation protein FlgA [Sphingomonas canadensis]|uniref:Flagella basal body P-ring formation protein FlgA n=1 Tax=Sphingomonas canadensis TaxID=1219257 RepID=A0ABW3H2A4_9SPHN|nr:flagella basal body P-ring formation protein FlgA [Sphingomonas canadensis]MCW3834838.1 flagella basal body P-ring formation protein FlgA [Sphingomonas canadensis]